MEDKYKQLHIILPKYLHTQIKECALKKEQTITQFIIRAVLEALQKETKSLPRA